MGRKLSVCNFQLKGLIMISQFANAEAVQERLNSSEDIAKLAHEVCKAFNLQLTNLPTSALGLLTPSGLDAGKICVTRGHNHKKNEVETVYYFESQVVNKEKGSTRSGRNVRDSVSISNLIKTIKKNNEIPTDEKIIKDYMQGMRYVFRNVGRNQSRPSLTITDDAVLALVRSHLGIDNSVPDAHTNAIRESYEKFEISMRQAKDNNAQKERFMKGVKIIGIMDNKYYLVGHASASKSVSNDIEITLHGPLKRYSSLRDCPELAGDLPIIRAYMEGRSEFSAANEFGLPVRDTYHEEIDVATGYVNFSQLWVGIPLHHE